MGRVILASCSDNKRHMNTPVSLGVCFTYVELILKKCEMDFQWKPEQMTEVTGDIHPVWVLQTLSVDGLPCKLRRENG